jgi:hypothetical protein
MHVDEISTRVCVREAQSRIMGRAAGMGLRQVVERGETKAQQLSHRPNNAFL